VRWIVQHPSGSLKARQDRGRCRLPGFRVWLLEPEDPASSLLLGLAARRRCGAGASGPTERIGRQRLKDRGGLPVVPRAAPNRRGGRERAKRSGQEPSCGKPRRSPRRARHGGTSSAAGRLRGERRERLRAARADPGTETRQDRLPREPDPLRQRGQCRAAGHGCAQAAGRPVERLAAIAAPGDAPAMTPQRPALSVHRGRDDPTAPWPVGPSQPR
jgi:hypothetical protein